MVIWQGSGYSPDWSADFFEVGGLEYDEGRDAYIVDDVDYCISMAEDWRDSRGDFCHDDPNPDNCVFVEMV